MNHPFAELPSLGRVAGVLVTQLHTEGSSPRESGARLFVTVDAIEGSIGGGQLEYLAIRRARERLANVERRSAHQSPVQGNPEDATQALPPVDNANLERVVLGARVGQCCGGTVQLLYETLASAAPSWLRTVQRHADKDEAAVLVIYLAEAGSLDHLVVSERDASGRLANDQRHDRAIAHARSMLLDRQAEGGFHEGCWFEPLRAPTLEVFLFGAGHVGQALASILDTIPCRLHWIDSRQEVFPAARQPTQDEPRWRVNEEPWNEIALIPSHAYVIIMTHSHALDERLVRQVLGDTDCQWCGLIGSDSKRRRFITRLRRAGIDQMALERLHCPIGVSGIRGKHPGQIAVAVAAELLQHHDGRLSCLDSDEHNDGVQQ